MNQDDITIYEDGDKLNIVRWFNLLRVAAENGGDLYWNRDGEVRVVPNAALINSLSLHHDYIKATLSGRLDEVPLAACFLFWCLATPILF